MSTKLSICIIWLMTNYLFENSIAIQIPNNLIHCYRGNETIPWTPNSLQLLIELIRKIEDANPTSMDIRTLSVNILHRLRIDGIQRAIKIKETDFITPYRPYGIMVPKFEVLLQLISNTPAPIEFEQFLTPSELCQLHRLISSSVEPYERGDESHVCPLNLMSDEGIWRNRNKVQDSFSKSLLSVSEGLSRCPLELGVIRHYDYGSFSPGIFIASVAAGLQPQNVRINEFVAVQNQRSPWENLETMTRRDSEKSLNNLLRSLDSMDNTYSAGLAGDLAEVCVYQGPYVGTNVTIGLIGTWNSTIFPRLRYLTENHRGKWEMTNAEILAGLDGLFISQQISSWINRIRRMRLSQVIDMYYSARGIPTLAIENSNRGVPINRKRFQQQQQEQFMKRGNHHRERDIEQLEINDDDKLSFTAKTHEKLQAIFDNPETEINANEHKKLERFSASDGISNACHRKKILQLIDKEKLKDETYYLSQVLQYTTSSFMITDELLRKNCDAAVDEFFESTVILLDTLLLCEDIPLDYRKPTVDLTLILDGSDDEYKRLQLISHISELIDTSSFGSYFSVVDGLNGQYLVNRTKSVSTAFQQIRTFNKTYPINYSLSHSLGTVLQQLSNQTYTEQKHGITVAQSLVLLIFSQDQRIIQSDFDSAANIIHKSFYQFPDIYLIFITNDPKTFEELIAKNDNTNEFMYRRNQEQYKIISTKNVTDTNEFSNELFNYLKTIPKRIIQPFCQHNSKEWRRKNSYEFKDYHEDYVSPNQELQYRISPFYLIKTEEFNIQFQGVSYGDLTVCVSRSADYVPINCETLSDSQTVWFNISRPCYDNAQDCRGIYFSIMLDKSNVKCSENDCRYPDQVRFIIKHQGLRCESDENSSTIISFNYRIFLVTLLIFIMNNYNF